VRRLILPLAAAAVAACASAGPPPGGPEDHSPPQIISLRPDSGQLNAKVKEVQFQFDEVVSDRPTGAASLDRMFLISPRNGEPRVSWHRSRISVRPERGFRDSTAYRITMLPGIADLRGNVRKDGATLVFSTGPTFPTLGIVGTVFDWAGQAIAKGAYVEAVAKRDGNKATELLQNHPTIIDTKNEKGDTPLLVVLRDEDSDWTGFLLNKGADVNAHGANGDTPLIAAAKAGFDDAAVWLLGMKADVDETNRSGETALIIAVQRGNARIVKLLLDHGANPDRTDAVAGYSARDYANRNSRAREIQKLIEDKKPKSASSAN